MKYHASSLLLLLSLSLPLSGSGLPVAHLVMPKQEEMEQEINRRQEAVRSAMLEVQTARHAYSAGRYTEAEESYRKALSLIPKADATKSQVSFIKHSLADALVAKAMDYRKVGRRDEAISFLKEAIDLNPKSSRAKLELEITQDPIQTNPALDPQHVGNVNEVNRLLTLGYSYMDLAKFDEAIKTFESVLKIDPYNKAAQRGIAEAHNHRSEYFDTAHDELRARMLAEVDGGWSVDLTKEGGATWEEQTGIILPGNQQSLADAAIRVNDALASINVPRLDLDEVSVSEFVDVLNGQIRQAASRGDLAGGSFNVIENFGSADSPHYQSLEKRTISLNLSNVNLLQVLDIATQQLGIQYQLLPEGVELTYSGEDFGPLRTRQYTVHPSFFRSGASREQEEESEFGDSAGVSMRRVSPQDVLKSMGVVFPAGASARYSTATQTLTVVNTDFNLSRLGELFSANQTTDRQILLNVYSMSVKEENLEELGFDWLIQGSVTDSLFAGGGVQAASSILSGLTEGDSVINETNSAPSVTTGLRSGAQVLNTASIDRLITAGSATAFAAQGQSKSPTILGFRGIWSGADLTILMRGLSQKKGTDMLSNPQVLFSAGEDRQILFANVREFFVPSEYTEPQLQSNDQGQDQFDNNDNDDDDDDQGGSGIVSAPIAAPAHPSAFEFVGTTEEQFNGIGATMAVHRAQLSPAGDSAVVDLTVVLNEFSGFVNWGSPILSAIANDDTIQSVPITENRILQPIFDRQMVNTSLELSTGDVVVFAALHEAKSIQFEDKVPIFGDIPYMGRLFRSSGSRTEKRVLLFFAQVSIIDPTGLDAQTGKRPIDVMGN